MLLVGFLFSFFVCPHDNPKVEGHLGDVSVNKSLAAWIENLNWAFQNLGKLGMEACVSLPSALSARQEVGTEESQKLWPISLAHAAASSKRHCLKPNTSELRTCTHMHNAHAHSHIHTYTHIYLYAHTWTHTVTYTYIHKHAHAYIHLYTHIHTIHEHTHTYTYMLIHT